MDFLAKKKSFFILEIHKINLDRTGLIGSLGNRKTNNIFLGLTTAVHCHCFTFFYYIGEFSRAGILKDRVWVAFH